MQQPMHAKAMSEQRKRWLIILCAALLVCATVGGSVTYAWLIHRPEPQVITLKGSNLALSVGNNNPKADYKLIPGSTINTVDVRVVASDASNINYAIFAKVEKSADFDTYLTYAYDSRWTVEENGNIVYLKHNQSLTDSDYDTENLAIFAGDTLTVKSEITKSSSYNSVLFANAAPSVTVTACAVQSDGIDDAKELELAKSALG